VGEHSLSYPPPVSKRATALPPDERRSMIVEATLPLLLEHGDRVTTRQIAEAAGIAEGTIFRAFGDKDEVITAVLDTALDVGPLDQAVAAIDPSLPFEDAAVAAIVIMQQRVIDVWRLVSSVGMRFHDRARRPIVDSDALTKLFEANRDHMRVEPAVAARLLRALTLSTTHPTIVDEPMSPDEILTLFLHGVAGGASC
jgi:AcrR family transcriptional regulator